MAQVVYSNATEGAGLDGKLFHGTKFWFSHRVPMRNHYIEQVKSNGGLIVPLEKQADILIVDHMRKDVAPGTHSWTYIDQSVKQGSLEDLHNHVAGPPAGTIRAVGSISRPASGVRKPYTGEDDRVLYEWVISSRDKGDKILGNEIYKQLEAINPRHPWQSWRDRWVKQLSHRPPPASRSNISSPLPSEGQADGQPAGRIATPSRSRQTRSPSYPRVEVVVKRPNFTEDDVRLLLSMATDVENIHPDRNDEAWDAFGDKYPDHSAHEWETFFKERVRPIHQAKVNKMKAKTAAKHAVSVAISSIASPTSKVSSDRALHSASNPLNGRYRSRRDPTDEQALGSPTFAPESPNLPAQPLQESVAIDHAILTPTHSRRKGDRAPPEINASSPSHRTLFVSTGDRQSPPNNHTKDIEVGAEGITVDRRKHSTAANGDRIVSKSQMAQVRPESVIHSEPEVEPAERSPGLIREQKHLVSLSRDTSTITSPQKREKIVIKDELQSSPIEPTTPHPSKRRRLQGIFNQDLEIPSTPDKNPSSIPQYTPTPSRTAKPGWEPDQEDEQSDVELGTAASETLSEPEQPGFGTQIILDDPVEEQDFDLPEPPGGWDDDLSGYDDDLEPEPEPRNQLRDTQAILTAATQVPDFTMPDPDGGWETILPSSPPPMPASSNTAPPLSAEEINARLDAWIDSRVAGGLSEDDVLLALKSTTMHTGLAEVVLESLVKGDGVPKGIQGIWTEEDDRDLEASNARVLKALERKHGRETFDARWIFLEDYRAGERL
ncbi:MAG: hypothetical protein M1812_007640 [Candelaria pacifica]|nr:MAG: hypothetical protein M1812_007640 [Candelaria pacifica]